MFSLEQTLSIVGGIVGIVGVIAGGISAYVAWRNSRTGQDKAKLDVMEVRRNAYERLREAVAPVNASAKVRTEDCDAFVGATHDMRYLFDKGIEQEAEEIYKASPSKRWNACFS